MATRSSFSVAAAFAPTALADTDTTMHTHPSSSHGSVYLWATNTSVTDQVGTFHIGTVASNNKIRIKIKAGETELIMDGLRIGSGGIITGKSGGSSGDLNAYGHYDLLD